MSLLNLDLLRSSQSSQEAGKLIQSEYRSAWNTLKLEHRGGMDSNEVIQQLTRLMDEVIGFVFDRTSRSMQEEGLKPDDSLVLVALGSYGRKELSPHSDVDLLFMLPERLTEWSRLFTERVLYTLWDTGLDVGYSSRTLSECFTLSAENYDVLTSLLDARYLQGNLPLFKKFQAEFRKKVLDRVGSDFVMTKLQAMNDRLEKHGGTIYVLEPNIKEGMGGLRDIHTAMWVAKTLFGVESLEDLNELDDLKILDDSDLRQLRNSFQFLQRVRCELHFASNAARDLLSMERQAYLAERFGFRPRKEVPAVERFMQTYYSHAGQVHHITENIIRRSLDRKRKRPKILARWKEKDLGDGFYSREGNLYTREDPITFFGNAPGRIMDAFLKYQGTNLEFSPELSVAVRRSLKLVNADYRKDRGIRNNFFKILNKDRRLYETLLAMNELRFLGKYIPEFATIHCKMQHDYYHTYTVDEHSIRAVREIVELSASPDESTQLYSQILGEMRGQRLLLLLTVLLHDVGKGLGANHAETGARMIAQAARRFGMDAEEVETMSFLVRNHLLLSHVAQRRDLHEEKTIIEVAKLMETTERLKLLYLLTMADLKAVGPGVWNEWKASLITELFLEANHAIEAGGLTREDLDAKIARAKARVLERMAEKFDESAVRSELDNLADRAFLVFRPRLLARLISLRLKMGERQVITSWRQARSGGHTEFCIVSHDQPGLFAKIAGVLAANNVNILGAQILTREDGIIFDLLHVTDSVMRPISDRMKYRLVSGELERVITGEVSVEDLLRGRKLSLPLHRRDRTVLEAPNRVDIHNDVSESYTVVDVYANDRIGLLYTITSTLSALGLTIHTAKVSTKVDQAVDVFYVADLAGRKIEDEGAIERIREELLGALEQ
ncbi:MAG: [protein-PII] uridylyltransferase [bacterium]|nr:MAG: [protein-PII] uridylyltransferase [bacterium]